MFYTRSTLIEDINFIVSRIIRLNSKLGELRREHKHDRTSLPNDKISAIRCTKCEGYGYKNYQCPNWNTKYMTLQELQDYIVYLKEVKRSVEQKLEVRREQQEKREREKVKRTLKEIWEKTRQERERKCGKSTKGNVGESKTRDRAKREKRARPKRVREEEAKRKKRARDERKRTKEERA